MPKPAHNQDLLDSILGDKIVPRKVFLPIPLRCIPTEQLSDFKLYVRKEDEYFEYQSLENTFGPRDYAQLVAKGIDFVHVSVSDYPRYYETIERYLVKIVSDPRLRLDRKTEILYTTSVNLAQQIHNSSPGKEDIDRIEKIVDVIIGLLFKEKKAFSKLFESFNHDSYLATHVVNVCILMLYLAYKIGITDKTILSRTGIGALLHDAGKSFLPQELLNDSTPLTQERLAQAQSHVRRGHEYLSKTIQLPCETLEIITQHHEYMDGSGYPKGLKGGQISILGRMAAIVDTFDAMTAVRPYRKDSYSVEEALQHIQNQAPQKYDIDLVRGFQKLIDSTLGLIDEKDDNILLSPEETANLGWLSVSCRSGKRRHIRHFFRLEGQLRRIKRIQGKPTLGTAENVIIHNISCTGLGLLSQQPLSPNENICVTILKNKKQTKINFIAIAVHCHEHQDGWFTIGAKFYEPQSNEVISRIKSPTCVHRINTLNK